MGLLQALKSERTSKLVEQLPIPIIVQSLIWLSQWTLFTCLLPTDKDLSSQQQIQVLSGLSNSVNLGRRWLFLLTRPFCLLGQSFIRLILANCPSWMALSLHLSLQIRILITNTSLSQIPEPYVLLTKVGSNLSIQIHLVLPCSSQEQ